jgi:hypothetical protein
MPTLHKSQREVGFNPARFKVLAAGRRWGKTRLGTLLCLSEALQGGRAWWVAPSYKTAVVGWRLVRRLSRQIPETTKNETERVIMFPGNGEIRIRSADDPDSLRGEGLDFLVMDECAYIRERAWSEVLRPALTDRQGRALFISTPSGRNWFWRLYQRGLDATGEWASWRKPTRDNPFLAESEIDDAEKMLPARTFQQEYLAEFLEHDGAVFRNIDACMHAPQPVGDHDEHYIVMGVDWGKHKDFTALSVGCADCAVEVDRDRFNQIDYAYQRQRLKALADQWNVNHIMAEMNAMGEPIVEQLASEGLPVEGFQTTATSKPRLIENLGLALERTEFQFVNDPVWTGELEAYEQTQTTTGRAKYSAPEGMHDDTVIARALMLWGATNRQWLVM